jgi:hypothetical protein
MMVVMKTEVYVLMVIKSRAMKSLCWLFLTVLSCIINMMDGLCPNLYFSASCKYVTICIREFTKKYPYSPNNLITDFMNLSN